MPSTSVILVGADALAISALDGEARCAASAVVAAIPIAMTETNRKKNPTPRIVTTQIPT
jgi:hypothetical protein